MGEWIGRGRKARRAYGFDEIAIVPGQVTVNPDEVDVSFDLAGRNYDIPKAVQYHAGLRRSRTASACAHWRCLSWTMCLSWTTPPVWPAWRKPNDVQNAAAVPASMRTSRLFKVFPTFSFPMAPC